jgi:hypothetical protein
MEFMSAIKHGCCKDHGTLLLNRLENIFVLLYAPFFFVLTIVGFELRALHLIGRRFTARATLTALYAVLFLCSSFFHLLLSSTPFPIFLLHILTDFSLKISFLKKHLPRPRLGLPSLLKAFLTLYNFPAEDLS